MIGLFFRCLFAVIVIGLLVVIILHQAESPPPEMLVDAAAPKGPPVTMNPKCMVIIVPVVPAQPMALPPPRSHVA